jgi:hypothetical protein
MKLGSIKGLRFDRDDSFISFSQMSSEPTKIATTSLAPAITVEKQPINRDNNSDNDSNSTTSSQELVWAPRPYYFCNKCLITLNLPEPEEREGNYLVEKK